MADIEQKATSTVYVNGEAAKQELEELRQKTLDWSKSLDQAEKDGNKALGKQLNKLIKEANKEMAGLQKQTIDVNRILKNLSTAKPKELSDTIKILNSRLNSRAVIRNSEEWNTLTKQIALARGELQRVNAEQQLGQSLSSRMTGGINKYFGTVTAAIAGITGAGLSVDQAVEKYTEMTDVYTDVMKYTNMTEEQVADLNEAFKKVDTRTTREQLNALANDAGRLGLKTKADILDFVEGADIIKVALGDDLGEDAVKNIGKMAEMFGVSDEKGLKQGMLSTASAINELAQSSSASEQYLLDFTARMAGTGKQAGISMTQIMGYASVLDQDMQQVEMSSTALQGIVMKMYQDPAKFAAMAGKDVTAFTKLLKEDANEALLQLLSTLQGQGGLDKLAPIFKEMNLDGARASGVISNLASNVEKIRGEQQLANKAFEEGNSVISEFTKNNTNAAAEQEKARKAINDQVEVLGEALYPTYTKVIQGSASMISLLIPLIKYVIEYKGAIVLATIALTTYNITKGKTIAELIRYISTSKAAITLMSTGKAVIYLWSAGFNLLTLNIGRAKAAMILFSRAISLSPIGLLITGITTLAVVVGSYIYKQYEANKALREMRAEMMKEQTAANNLFISLSKAAEGTQRRKELIDEINNKYKDYLPFMLSEKSSLNDIRDAQEAVNKAIQTNIALKTQQKSVEEIENKAIQEKAKQIEDIRKKLTEKLPDSEVERALQNIVSQTDKILEKGFDKGSASRGVFKNLKDSFFGGIDNSVESGTYQEIQDYVDVVYDTAKKIAAEKKRYSPFILDATANKNELPEVVITGKSPTVDSGTVTQYDEKAETKAAKEKKKAQDKALKDLQDYYELAQTNLKNSYLLQEISKAEYERLLAQIEITALEARVDRLKAYGENTGKVENELLEKRLDFLKKYGKQLNITDFTGGVKAEEEEADAALDAQIEKWKTTYSVKQAMLVNDYEKGLITQQEYQEAERKLLQEHLQMKLQAYMDNAQAVNDISNQAGDLVDALQQREEISIETKYAKELKAAKGNAAKTAEINERMEQEKKEMKKKYADVDFMISAAQIVSSTAMGIMNVWSKWGWNPAVAIPMAALIGLTGAAQLAVSNEQRKAVKNMWTGGFTPSGAWNEEQGIVHSNEFVGNRFAVANPSVRRIFNVIDQAQRNNTVSTLNDQTIAAAMGFKVDAMNATRLMGGNPSPSSYNTVQDDQVLVSTLAVMAESIQRLNDRLDDDIVAVASISGNDGVDKKQKDYNRLIKNVSR